MYYFYLQYRCCGFPVRERGYLTNEIFAFIVYRSGKKVLAGEGSGKENFIVFEKKCIFASYSPMLKGAPGAASGS